MHKTKPSSLSSLTTTIPRFYFVLPITIALILVYWFSSYGSFSDRILLADVSQLPRSSLFTYANISSELHIAETQGLLYVPPPDRSAHFASIKSHAVRGNHRHKDNENSISGEVIILLAGQFQFRIGDGDTNKYEDHQFDVHKTGVVALQFSADKCHALKNIGKQINWFASYYIKSKDIKTPSVDREGCKKMSLT